MNASFVRTGNKHYRHITELCHWPRMPRRLLNATSLSIHDIGLQLVLPFILLVQSTVDRAECVNITDKQSSQTQGTIVKALSLEKPTYR